jgi:hypothetical protein
MHGPPARSWVQMLRSFCHWAELQPDERLEANQTDSDTRESLYGCLAREMGQIVTPVFIESIDIENRTFTYRHGERLMQRTWEVGDDGLIQLAGETLDVQRRTEYVAVPGASPTPPAVPQPAVYEETTMPKFPERVTALVTHARSGFAETDRPWLEALEEPALARLEALCNSDCPQCQGQGPGHEAGTMPQGTHPTNMHEAVAQLPEAYRQPLQAMVREYDGRKAAAIAQLTANQQCPFGQADLQAMTVEQLEGLVCMSSVHGVQVVPGNYQGRGLPVQPEPPAAPPNILALAVERQRLIGNRT